MLCECAHSGSCTAKWPCVPEECRGAETSGLPEPEEKCVWRRHVCSGREAAFFEIPMEAVRLREA